LTPGGPLKLAVGGDIEEIRRGQAEYIPKLSAWNGEAIIDA